MRHDLFHWNITVPVNTRATVCIPEINRSAFTENDTAVNESEGVDFLRMENGEAVFSVTSGSYNFMSSGL